MIVVSDELCPDEMVDGVAEIVGGFKVGGVAVPVMVMVKVALDPSQAVGVDDRSERSD